MIMGLNRKLTRVVKDRVIQNFQMTGSELLIGFGDGSTMKVKIVESNSPPLPRGARIRRISEDQAKLVIECEGDSSIDLTLADPGASVAVQWPSSPCLCLNPRLWDCWPSAPPLSSSVAAKNKSP
jgi:hypothetical protein